MQFLLGNLLERIDPHSVKFPLIVFNHPYYPSPSNVFNVGGPKAGLDCIKPFLEQARSFLKLGGGVVMPSADIATLKHDPVRVAHSLEYDAKQLTKREHPRYGEHYIYLFTLQSDQRQAQRSGA
jgi:methylase of polypeptide subunit release factors